MIAHPVPQSKTRRRSLFSWRTGAGLYLVAACAVFGSIVYPTVGPSVKPRDAALGLAYVAGVGGVAVLGAAIVRVQPRNAIGWIFQGLAFVAAFSAVAGGVARFGAPGSRVSKLGWWYENWNWAPLIGVTVTYVLLLFPNGHLPDRRRRWRVVAWSAGLATGALSIAVAFGPGPLDDPPGVLNPFPIPGVDWLWPVFALLLPVGVVGSVAALFVRRRRAHGVEREQLRWLFAAGSLLATTFALNFALGSAVPATRVFVDSAVLAALALVPIAVTVAILRYRLYDIDRLISRTVSYAVLTALLVLPYVGIVSLVSRVVAGSSVGVAAATLAVAALFNPLRRRVQAAVDRRFNRSRYDAARTVDAFSARLREQVDLESLRTELLRVVTQTMQPATVSVWLRSP